MLKRAVDTPSSRGANGPVRWKSGVKGNKQQGRLVVIGENIHATGVVLKQGPRFTAEGDEEAVRFVSADGEERLPRIPGSAMVGQDYGKVRVKYGKIAIQMPIEGVPDEEFGLSHLAA